MGVLYSGVTKPLLIDTSDANKPIEFKDAYNMYGIKWTGLASYTSSEL